MFALWHLVPWLESLHFWDLKLAERIWWLVCWLFLLTG